MYFFSKNKEKRKKDMYQWVVIFASVSHLLDFDMDDVISFDTKYFFLFLEVERGETDLIEHVKKNLV